MRGVLLFLLSLARIFTSKRLGPVDAVMSSVYRGYSADKCIDGEEGGEDPGISDEENMCQTQSEPFPWLALDFGTPVKVTEVVLVNRKSEGGDLAQGIEVRVADELPTSSQELFTGGNLLGIYEGPGRQKIPIPDPKVKTVEMLVGRFLIVQMDNGEDAPLHLKEVSAWGFGGEVLESLKENLNIVKLVFMFQTQPYWKRTAMFLARKTAQEKAMSLH